jgi:hypothetical protein
MAAWKKMFVHTSSVGACKECIVYTRQKPRSTPKTVVNESSKSQRQRHHLTNTPQRCVNRRRRIFHFYYVTVPKYGRLGLTLNVRVHGPPPETDPIQIQRKRNQQQHNQSANYADRHTTASTTLSTLHSNLSHTVPRNENKHVCTRERGS